MKVLCTLVFVLFQYQISNGAHIRKNNKRGDEVTTIVNKVKEYINDINSVVKDIQSEQDLDIAEINMLNDVEYLKQKKGENKFNEEDIDYEICQHKENENKTVCRIPGSDIIYDVDSTESRKRVVPDYAKKWWYRDYDDKIYVPYKITGAYASAQLNVIKAAIADFNSKFTCGMWVEHTNEENYVDIINDRGCYSYIGMLNRGRQPLSLQHGGGSCVYTGIIQHEMMHAMGFLHEQSRPDRNKSITINWDKIKPGYEGNFRIENDIKVEAVLNNDEYDFGSVLHYGAKAFSIDGSNTITTLDASKQSVIGQRVGLSDIDVDELNNYYCGKNSSPSYEDGIVVDCKRFYSCHSTNTPITPIMGRLQAAQRYCTKSNCGEMSVRYSIKESYDPNTNATYHLTFQYTGWGKFKVSSASFSTAVPNKDKVKDTSKLSQDGPTPTGNVCLDFVGKANNGIFKPLMIKILVIKVKYSDSDLVIDNVRLNKGLCP